MLLDQAVALRDSGERAAAPQVCVARRLFDGSKAPRGCKSAIANEEPTDIPNRTNWMLTIKSKCFYCLMA